MANTADVELARTAAADLAGKFWDLGNVIAGFAILQFLGFLYVTFSTPGNEIRERSSATPGCFVL